LESELSEAAKAKQRFSGARNRQIAQSPRPDGLTMLIDEIVKRNARITSKKLLDALRSHGGQGVIDDITSTNEINEGNNPSNPVAISIALPLVIEAFGSTHLTENARQFSTRISNQSGM
jgi:hypothetical protein